MGLIKLKCPSCGADIQFDGSNDFGFCTYCGTKVMQEKTIIEHKGEINVNIIQKPVKVTNYDFEKKFAEVKNLERQYFEYGPEVSAYSKREAFHKVMNCFRAAKEAGPNESRYYAEYADFYVRGNLELMKSGKLILTSREQFISHYILTMDNAIMYNDDDKEKQALEKKKNDTVAYLKEELCKIKEHPDKCYIATCVYGSYDCPQVWTLRRYRDNTLYKTWYGRLFIQIYYTVSPILVKTFGNTQHFKRTWQRLLDRIVNNLKDKGIEDTEYRGR